KQLIKKELEVFVESGAGINSFFSDADYKAAGATIESKEKVCSCHVILKVNAPTLEEAKAMKEDSFCISLLYAYTQPELIAIFNSKRITAFAMDAVPRISRAQKMDALSSQANLAGYKAVILAADA